MRTGPDFASAVGMMRFWRKLMRIGLPPALLCLAAAQARAETRLVVTPVGPEIVLYDPARQGCDPNDIPDMPLRAYRDVEGRVAAFALHFDNRRLSGPSIEQLKLECAIVFRATRNGDPRLYDDRAWLAATYTSDGKRVIGLVHHEFQAHAHPGRCSFPEYMSCWWNSVLAVESNDGGKSFSRRGPGVVAATPQPSETGQGRHRGFFNPSNIVKQGAGHFALIATTGWAEQPSGACLFRADDPGDARSWRAYDGRGFSARFPDPYGPETTKGQTCLPLPPFPAPVGSITRHRGSGLWIALFQAKAGMPDGRGGNFAASGFYAATSRDLLVWGQPTLVLEAATLYDDPCGQRALLSYPSLIDSAAETRNFEDAGDTALLTFAEKRVEGCRITHQRRLLARKVRISAFTAQ